MTLAQLIQINAKSTAGLPTKIFTVSASQDVLDRFERFLSHVQWCAGAGHSCEVKFSIDGDGADRFHVKEKLPKLSEEEGAKLEV